MQEIKFKLTGKTPLLMHNERLAIPIDPYAQLIAKLAAKRKKKICDYEEIARIEWEGGLYLTDGIVQLPAHMVEASIVAGAKMNKKGTAFKSGAMLGEICYPLKYNGPQIRMTNGVAEIPNPKLDKVYPLYRDQRNVKIGKAKVFRTRPRFITWAVTFDIVFDNAIIEDGDLRLAVANAGNYKGIGDYRPRFGRFDAEVIE